MTGDTKYIPVGARVRIRPSSFYCKYLFGRIAIVEEYYPGCVYCYCIRLEDDFCKVKEESNKAGGLVLQLPKHCFDGLYDPDNFNHRCYHLLVKVDELEVIPDA